MLMGRDILAACRSDQPDQAISIHAGTDIPVSRLRFFAHAVKPGDTTFYGLYKLPFCPVEHNKRIIPPDAGEARVRCGQILSFSPGNLSVQVAACLPMVFR